jgi:hypothetical protein
MTSPERGGLAEGAREPQHPDGGLLPQRGELRRHRQTAVHDEDELVGEPAGLELA